MGSQEGQQAWSYSQLHEQLAVLYVTCILMSVLVKFGPMELKDITKIRWIHTLKIMKVNVSILCFYYLEFQNFSFLYLLWYDSCQSVCTCFQSPIIQLLGCFYSKLCQLFAYVWKTEEALFNFKSIKKINMGIFLSIYLTLFDTFKYQI